MQIFITGEFDDRYEYEKLIKKLENENIKCYYRDTVLPKEGLRKYNDGLLDKIKHSDLVLFYITKGQLNSLGYDNFYHDTCWELGYAHAFNKKIFVYSHYACTRQIQRMDYIKMISSNNKFRDENKLINSILELSKKKTSLKRKRLH